MRSSGVGFKLHTCFIIGMLVFWITSKYWTHSGPLFSEYSRHIQYPNLSVWETSAISCYNIHKCI